MEEKQYLIENFEKKNKIFLSNIYSKFQLCKYVLIVVYSAFNWFVNQTSFFIYFFTLILLLFVPSMTKAPQILILIQTLNLTTNNGALTKLIKKRNRGI